VLTEEKLDDIWASSDPRTEEELNENIRGEISNIAPENLQGVNQNLSRRCEESLRVERGTAVSTPSVVCDQR
jgi:hypothetical protein